MAAFSFENHYKDTWVKGIGSFIIAHFIRQIGSNESILEMLLQPVYYIEVACGTCIAFLAWEWVSRTTSWLDKEYGWFEHSTSRILLQVIFGVMAPSLLIFFLVFLQFKYIINYDIFQTPWLLYEYPVSIMCLVCINGYYVGYYFYNRYQEIRRQLELTQKEFIATAVVPHAQLAIPSEKAADPRAQVIIVTKGIKNVPVPVEEIAYCYIHEQYNYLKTFREETFLVNQTLDELMAVLPPETFYRANRQYIVHIQACESYASIENGKLQVFVKPAHKEGIIVSQKKAREFKEWVINRA